MGIDLIGHGGASFNWDSWRRCLNLACAFGWLPAGTLAPENFDGDWDRTYCSNDLQKVTDDDARAIGAALRQAITALRTGQYLTVEQAEAWDGIEVGTVSKFADYCEKGGFAIL